MDTKALHTLSYGVYVVGARKGDKLNAQIANTAFQVTSEPPTFAVSINKNNLTHSFIKESKAFSVSILREATPLSFVGHFGFKSGRDIDKLENIKYKTGETESPVILENAVACLEVRVIQQIDVGTHTIFIGEVIAAEVITEETPMTYAYYHKVKRGTTPKAAPTYAEKKKE